MTFLLGNVLQFDWLAIPDSGWLWHMLTFIAIWTVGLFVVQAKTLVSPQYNTRRFRHWAPRIRFLIDLCFATAITMLVPPIGLVIISVAAFFADVGLIAHYQYFRRPLSALTLYLNWREGAHATRRSLSAQSKRLILICGAALILKVALIIHAPDPGARKTLWLVGAMAIAAYLALMALASSIDPLNGILTTRGIGRLGTIRGYLFTWLAEFIYLGKRQVLDDAIRQRQVTSDALTPVEATIPIRDQLVIVQVESLDYNVYGRTHDGQEVTPFLNRLREQSLFYRITAARYIGTADADFIMLNGVMPSSHITTYNIPGYPYHNTLPQYLAQFGYRTSMFHGNTGNFYNRRAAFEKMGFAELHFEEEMKEQDRLPKSAWGIEDKDVLGYSGRILRESNGRVCHFIITLTTHTPYELLSDEREVVASPQSIAQNYLNNMRYLDNQFREYIGSLTSATVVIFSDHPADPAVAPEFVSDYRGDRAFVPCLIYDTESNLGAIQRTRGQPLAEDGSLTLLDISNYLRKQIALSHGQAPLATSQSGGWPSLSAK